MSPIKGSAVPSAVLIVVFFCVLLAAAQTPYDPNRIREGKEAEYDLVFWYEETEMTVFFREAATEYETLTGKRVKLCEKESTSFPEDIYDESIADGEFPDLYLAGSEISEKVYLYGISEKESVPLYFETVMFVYHGEQLAQKPGSLYDLLQDTEENGLPEGVSNALEWNVADGFYDYPFFADVITYDFSDEESALAEDSESYRQRASFFETLAAATLLDEKTVTDEEVLEDFQAGHCLCALISSDDLIDVTAEDCVLAELPDLAPGIPMRSCSRQGCLYLNDFSRNKNTARDFANYLVEQKSDDLEEMTGHHPVKENAVRSLQGELAYRQYQDSIPVPESIHSGSFWAKFEGEMYNLWHAGVLSREP